MASEIISIDGDFVHVRISGVMTVADLRMIQEACVSRGHGLRLLIILENFQGWEQTSAWEQTAFIPDQDRQMQKMAIVGNAQWRDQACAFVAKGLRSFEIEYFLPSECAEAESWLKA